MRVSYLFVFLLNAVLLLGFFYFIQHRQVISEGKYREKLKKSKTSIDFQQRLISGIFRHIHVRSQGRNCESCCETGNARFWDSLPEN